MAELLLTPILLTGGMFASWAMYGKGDAHSSHVAEKLDHRHDRVLSDAPTADNAGVLLDKLDTIPVSQDINAKVYSAMEAMSISHLRKSSPSELATLAMSILPQVPPLDYHDAKKVIKIEKPVTDTTDKGDEETESVAEIISPQGHTRHSSSKTSKKRRRINSDEEVLESFLNRPDIKVQVVEDNSREFKDICTSFTTNAMLSDPSKNFNFLKLVITTMNASLDAYATKHKLDRRSIIFMYKGGNIFRILNTNFLSSLPADARKTLFDAYNTAFGRSDADFELLISHDIPNYDMHFSAISRLAYITLCLIRNAIAETPTDYIQYMTYSSKYQQQLMSLPILVNTFANAEAFKNPANTTYFGKSFTGLSLDGIGIVCDPATGTVSETALAKDMNSGLPPYVGRRDFVIQRSSEADPMLYDSIMIYPTSDAANLIYCYFNDSIRFRTLADELVEFKLLRAKINFDVYFNEKLYLIGGELIDISMPTKLDYKARRLLTFPYEEVFHTYHLIDESSGEAIDFTGYTIKELTTDLGQTLFMESPPWEVKKYIKRLKRMMFLLLLDFIAIAKYDLRKLAKVYAELSAMVKYCSDNPLAKKILPALINYSETLTSLGDHITSDDDKHAKSVIDLLFYFLVHTLSARSANTFPLEKVVEFFGYIQVECGVAATVIQTLLNFSTKNLFATESLVYHAMNT